MTEPTVTIRVTIHPNDNLIVSLSEAELLEAQGLVCAGWHHVIHTARADYDAGKEHAHALALIATARRRKDRERAMTAWPTIIATLDGALRAIAERHSPYPDTPRCKHCIDSTDYDLTSMPWPCPDAVDILDASTGETWGHVLEGDDE